MATSPANIFDEFSPARLPVDTQIESLQKLQKAAQKISSILDLDQLIDNIVNDVAHSFGLLETSVYLHDEARGEMVMGGVHGCSIHSKGFRLKIGKEGMVGYVASTGQMRYAPDVRKDEYYVGCEESTQSEVAIPLQVGERLVGVFTASHPDLDAFPRQQLRLLQALCDHMAVAIYNANRFQSERRKLAPFNRLFCQSPRRTCRASPFPG
jgi:sigma-B regulation protein RsbU (phosphoserine phosphatase)